MGGIDRRRLLSDGVLLEFHSFMKHFVSIFSNDCSDAMSSSFVGSCCDWFIVRINVSQGPSFVI